MLHGGAGQEGLVRDYPRASEMATVRVRVRGRVRVRVRVRARV